jgi:hypothetical protein
MSTKLPDAARGRKLPEDRIVVDNVHYRLPEESSSMISHTPYLHISYHEKLGKHFLCRRRLQHDWFFRESATGYIYDSSICNMRI